MPTGLTKLQKELLEVVRELETGQIEDKRITRYGRRRKLSTTYGLYTIVAERRFNRGEITRGTSLMGTYYYNWSEFNVARSLKALEGRGLLGRCAYRPYWWHTPQWAEENNYSFKKITRRRNWT